MKKFFILIFIFFKVTSIDINHNISNKEDILKVVEVLKYLKSFEILVNSDSLEKFELKINQASILELKKILETPLHFRFGIDNETIDFLKFTFKLITFSIFLYKIISLIREFKKNKLLLY